MKPNIAMVYSSKID